MTMIHAYFFIFFFQLLSLTVATESGIVGGRVAKPHSRPYMASLQLRGHHKCGGILIREDFVLTAAHCENLGMTVVLGAHDISKKEKSQQWIQVAKFHPHPKFVDEKRDYDIMLLELKNKATLNKYVKVIGLPKKDGKVLANINCAVAGWGQTEANKLDASPVLKETTEKTQFSSECLNKWGDVFKINQMICTKFDKRKGGICKRDSGGPLICNSKPQGLAAFISKGDCNNPKHPHVFTKIGFFLPWIKEVMKGIGE